MAKLFKTTFKLRRGSSEVWDKNNPVLAYGEPGFDKDKYIFKIGDGKRNWRDLKPIGATVQPDWNQNDETAEDFIKNRIAYTEGGFTVAETIFEEVLNGTSVEPTPHGGKQFAFEAPLIGGTWYRVTLDGKVYDVCCEKVTGEDLGVYENIHFLGNIGYMNQTLIDADVDLRFTNEVTNEPFVATYNLIGAQGSGAIQIGYSADSYTVSIQRLEGTPEIVHKLDPKYYERLAWEEGTDEVVYDQKLTFSDGVVEAIIVDAFLIAGDKYNVKIGDSSWDVTAYSIIADGMSIVTLGNQRIAFGDAGIVDLDKPFVVGYGHIEGEHFLLVMALDPEVFPNEEIPLEGEHRITITHRNTTIKKIDEKFLPDSVPTTPNYEQNNYFARDYIKNRPFYSGILKTTAAEAIAHGAPVYDIMPNNPGRAFVVKICDYIPFNDDMRSARFWGVSVDEGYGIEVLDYGWRIGDNDDTPIIAIKDIDLFNESLNGHESFEEPGIYMYYIAGYEEVFTIELPIKKEYSGENIKIDWENIKDAPFGKISGRRIVGCEYNTGKERYYIKENSSTQTEEAIFYRFCPYYFTADEMIGCKLLLSDGSTLVVADDSFLHKNSKVGFWEINNLIISSDEANPHEESGTYLYYSGGGAPINGTFTSDTTGVYVKEIIFPDEIKQIPVELIPNEIPRVNSAKTGEAIVVKSVNDDETAAVCETVELPGWKKSNTVTFDGVIGDKYCIPLTQPNNSNHQLVQVSERPFEITEETLTELNLKVFDQIHGKDELDFTIEQDGQFTIIGNEDIHAIVIAHQDISEGDMIMPKGVYFMYGGDKFYITSVSCKEVSQINPEFLPEGGFGHTTSSVKTVTWDGVVDNKLMINFDDHVYLVKISVAPIDFEKSAPIKVTAQQETVSKTFDSLQVMNEEMDNGSFSMVLSNDFGKTTLLAMSVFGTLPTESETMYEEGLYLAKFVGSSSSAGYVSSLEYNAKTIHKIDPKFIPTEGLASEDYVDESVVQAKEYADSQRLGYKEQNIITWDGDTEGKKELPAGDNIVLYKVSDVPVKITKDNIKKILLNDGKTVDQIAEEQNGTISVASQSDENGATLTVVAVVAGAYTAQFVAVADDDIYSDGALVIEKGVYFFGNEESGIFVSVIELETIHQIPIEYIPATVITDEEVDALIASII